MKSFEYKGVKYTKVKEENTKQPCIGCAFWQLDRGECEVAAMDKDCMREKIIYKKIEDNKSE